MEVQTDLARNIELAEGKAALDAVCKRLTANKAILAWIMKSCTEEYEECSLQDIEEKYIEGTPQVAQQAVHRDMADETEMTMPFI